jgi:gliding motility-associated-like protein
MKKVILYLVSTLCIAACTKEPVAPKVSDSEITYRSEVVISRNNVNGILNLDTILLVYIPNAFTPNGDGTNDKFIIKGTGIENYSIDIFDRWGTNIFSSTDINEGWDGTLSGKEKSGNGIYNYQINVTDKTTGNKHTYTGEVMLVH